MPDLLAPNGPFRMWLRHTWTGPICRRCGTPVRDIQTSIDRDQDLIYIDFYCHMARTRMPVSIAGLMRFRRGSDTSWADAVFPKYVFDYAPHHFGSWDANGSPLPQPEALS